MALIFCSMLLASCARTYAPYAISTVSTVSLADLQHSLQRKDYEILDTVKAQAVVTVHPSRKGVRIEADDFVNVCEYGDNKKGSFFSAPQQTQVPEQQLIYNIAKSQGTLRYGFIDGLNLKKPEECDGNSMASFLAAYRLINEVKASDADGIVSPSLYVTAEEEGRRSRNITYTVVISAKLIKLTTNR